MMPYKKGFGEWIQKTFPKSENGTLFKHQSFVRDFMEKGPYRGIYLYHGLGVGKTRSAIEIARMNPDREIVVMLPASLKENFIGEITKANFNMKKFQFMSYNGINKKNIKQYIETDFFDNKIVIIDEVHNFISRSSGNGLIGKQLYQCLMEAKNMKLVALSGTPIINKPIEIAFLLNLIHGYINNIVYKYDGYTDFEKLKNLIMDIDSIATCHIDTEINTISISLLPNGFKYQNEMIVETSEVKDTEAIVKKIIRSSSLTIKKEIFSKNTLLPFKDEEWDATFVDYDSANCKNQILFSRRIQGLVSYYESYDPKSYPEQFPLKIVNCPMSKTHFGRYLVVRQEEISKEQKAARFGKKSIDSEAAKKKDEIKNGNVYRSFSRAVCNFGFPTNINRPYPSTLREFKYDVDEPGDIEESSVEKLEKGKGVLKKLYETKIAEALYKLETNKEHLNKDGLKEHGPKMYEIVKRLSKSPGTSLIYSMFRNVEGLRIMSMAIQNALKWSELTVKKQSNGHWQLMCDNFSSPGKYIVFTDNREETAILLALYNNDFEKLPQSVRDQLDSLNIKSNLKGEFIKCLMITQSGSEGISLKNVRQVHVMEPYWNHIRLKQVIGRAVRAGSHLSLPESERNVQSFLYITVLNEEQKEHSLIKAHDDGLTSDGYVYNIAKKKEKINEKFLQLIKNSSIDCNLHKKSHVNIDCFLPPYTKDGHVFYYGDIKKDIPDKEILKKEKYVKEFKTLFLKINDIEVICLTNPTKQDITKINIEIKKENLEGDWKGLYFISDTKNLIGLFQPKDKIRWLIKVDKREKIKP